MHYHINSSSITSHDSASPKAQVSSYPQYEEYSPQWSERSFGSSSSTSSGVPIPRTPYMQTVPLPNPSAAQASRPSVAHISHQNPHQTPSVISLNPLLSYDPSTRMLFNVSRDMAYIQLRPGCSSNTLQEPALYPPATQMLIIMPNLPLWPIRVINPRGITANDVLIQIHDALTRGAGQNEVNTLDNAARAAVVDSFRARSLGNQTEYMQGVKRVDFLGRKNLFAGLTRACDGQDRWDIHFVASA